eukprot:CAMPEP_0185730636 /NCGR_PEP_ID=MMETSP1171-20130828/10535_1 /TAXON_ID=374046 /ORGANISM="Helicotheca tamensis, Strain CCMP826" /LENGTH=78 /DNA_ID=CAMNT_0028399729 /DNA_START=106 /DNA_END=342 /DNA_ORIENTATION=-
MNDTKGAAKQTKTYDDDYDDGDKYDDYDDYALQGGKGEGTMKQQKPGKSSGKGGGGSVYSSKHTRIRASRPRTASPKR